MKNLETFQKLMLREVKLKYYRDQLTEEITKKNFERDLKNVFRKFTKDEFDHDNIKIRVEDDPDDRFNVIPENIFTALLFTGHYEPAVNLIDVTEFKVDEYDTYIYNPEKNKIRIRTTLTSYAQPTT